ncbi:MAG TPA: thiol:disulfide interchange protein DsbA/DsbL [Gammaproteobacteria bacterium]|nr:thiol:disulfide interchange protein DsbA/DsbL [Gammaproteobacteria bacterium]
MRAIAFALVTVILAAACSAEPPAGPAANPPAAQSQAQAPAQAPAAERPAPAAQPAAETSRPAQPPSNARFVAGQHYRVLNPAQPTSVPPGKVEVVDVFWYGCGGCYLMHPYMARWKEAKPAAAEYVRLPATLNPGWQPQARLYFATKALGIEDQTHAAIFNEYHANRNPLNTMELQVKFLSGYGISEQAAREALTSFSVDTELRAADVRARRYQLSFVPAVVVNGKYVVGVEQAGGPDSVLEVINYLVALEAGS